MALMLPFLNVMKVLQIKLVLVVILIGLRLLHDFVIGPPRRTGAVP